jgi:hypothetical protein
MSPTVFRERGYRFFFFSREEVRMHVHVVSGDGEAKSWLEPEIVLARNYNFVGQSSVGFRFLFRTAREYQTTGTITRKVIIPRNTV